jgi:hypothetical protein
MVIVYTDDNINHKVKPNCDDEGNNCTNEGNNPTNKEIEQFVLSKNNTIEHTCNRSFCVVVDNMMNKYVFDGNNFTNYQFLTTP